MYSCKHYVFIHSYILIHTVYSPVFIYIILPRFPLIVSFWGHLCPSLGLRPPKPLFLYTDFNYSLVTSINPGISTTQETVETLQNLIHTARVVFETVRLVIRNYCFIYEFLLPVNCLWTDPLSLAYPNDPSNSHSAWHLPESQYIFSNNKGHSESLQISEFIP